MSTMEKLKGRSAADMTKQSMVHCYREGFPPLLQVHDELVFSIDDKKDVESICKIMEEAVPLDVPNKVDAEVGKTWDSMVANKN